MKTIQTGPKEEMTPMMAQYMAIKEQHQDYLLFYRMGDFYELFFDDAVQAAAALNITLTKRGKHLGKDIPMAGVPAHAHDTYLQRLIRQGFKVAVCEQVEDPLETRKRRGYKAVVEREVTRLVTSGTLTEDTLLDARSHNYLAALAEAQGQMGLSWLEMSTGEFKVQSITTGTLPAALVRINPGEVLLSDRLAQKSNLSESLNGYKAALTLLPGVRFDSQNGRKRLEKLFGVTTLDAFGSFQRAELAAAGALVDYVELTQRGKLPRLSPLQRLAEGAVMEIDAATRRNLELSFTLSGERSGSLLHAIDHTTTGAGARLLAVRLAAPLTDAIQINKRLNMVHFFYDEAATRDKLRTVLRYCPDLERALSRLTIGRGGPRDLAVIRNGLAVTGEVRSLLETTSLPKRPVEIVACEKNLGAHGALVSCLHQALATELPPLARDGGFIAQGYSAELDELKTLRDESRRLIIALQGKYVAKTGISSLKIRNNNVLGYFVEVPAKQADKITIGPNSPFIHRQTMANAVRYSTVELSNLEGKIAQAADKTLAHELELFDKLVNQILVHTESIAKAAASLASLDVASALAHLAIERNYSRPIIDNSLDFHVVRGRHPVVEMALERSQDVPFVANDCNMTPDNRLWLLTGPNMAGKSTFLRQNALIVVLAQMGSYVPAKSARLGIVDRLFSRVGAADDLARGRSTFMVEMIETATILNQATKCSLVILDEIGRGTATFDGLSIAWAVIEHLHEVNCSRALFATHYHELTGLATKLHALSCHTMRVKEWKNDVVFLHEVGTGVADRSYGIHVGRMAGLPATVVVRAEQVLKNLEKGEQSSALTDLAEDLPLFAAILDSPPAQTITSSLVEKILNDVSPDELTPKEALEILYKLKNIKLS